jgi:hypothetical protein
MRRRFGVWLAAALKPPLLVLGWVAGGIYKVLFSRTDEELAKKHEEKLAADIQNVLPFLFDEMGGRIVPNEGVEFPPPFDYAVITVDTPHIRLRFTSGRDHLAVQIAPKFSPNRWHELSTVLSVLEVHGLQRGSISGLAQAGRVLHRHVSEITDAFTEERYSDLRAQLQEIYERDRIVTNQLETEINRRLYPQE